MKLNLKISITLAFIAIIFALSGNRVYCACYSDYLSKRDEKAFRDIFEDLEISDRIHYGTFNNLCENIVNEAGNLREIVSKSILEPSSLGGADKDKLSDCKILLIDEVDVFFSKDFLGESYYISTPIRDPLISKLFFKLWDSRNASKLTLANVKLYPEYQAIKDKFKKWTSLIDETIKDMIADLYDYEYPHEVFEDHIGVRLYGTFVTNQIKGYKTAFLHFDEHEKKNISRNSLDNSLFLNFKSGFFSYAEIALQFSRIIGVTGTLKDIGNLQNDIIKSNFEVKIKTFIPSVYGTNKRSFSEIADVYTFNDKDNYLTLVQNIKDNLQNRAVLVFFESESNLNEFISHQKAAEFNNDETNILKEDTDDDKKELFIKYATKQKQLTLCTRVYGRGFNLIL